MGHIWLVLGLLVLTRAHLSLGAVEDADCDFETDFCNWVQSTADSTNAEGHTPATFDWTRQGGGTSSSKTGPPSAKQGSKYIYIEASSKTNMARQEGDFADLESPEFSSVASTGLCMRFSYHIYGSTMGRLKVILKPTSGGTTETVWELPEDQGNEWHEATIHFDFSTNSKIVISAIRGSNYRSDIAIDDIRFTADECDPNACGSVSSSKRVINGQDVSENQFPWVIRLKIKNPITNKWGRCGGSLIHERWVLSAAHCIEQSGSFMTDADNIKVYIGDRDISTSEPSQMMVFPEQVFVHPDRNANSSGPYDIMLLKLKYPVGITDQVHTVCLPDSGSSPAVGTSCVVAGWGLINSTTFPTVQQYGAQEIVDVSECVTVYGSSAVYDDNLCSDNTDDINACTGDSGGPLFCLNNGNYEQVGIVSAGSACGNFNPKMFCDVSVYRTWIDGIIDQN